MKKANIYNKNNEEGKERSNDKISFINFITFHWITRLINSIKKNEEFVLPNIGKKPIIGYYEYYLMKNLKVFKSKKKSFLSRFFSKILSYIFYFKKSDKNKNNINGVENDNSFYEYNRGIIMALVYTFKKPIIVISILYMIHALYLVFVAICIEKYIAIIKGHHVFSPIFQLKFAKLLSAFALIIVLSFNLLLDSVVSYMGSKIIIDMEVTVMHFLYKINMGMFNHCILSPYADNNNNNNLLEPINNNSENSTCANINSPMLLDRKNIDSNKNKTCDTSNNCVIKVEDEHENGEYKNKTNQSNANTTSNTNNLTDFSKRKGSNSSLGEDNENRNNDGDINIYNIMFIDTPSIIYFISSSVMANGMIIKLIISFCMFYHKMGKKSILGGILLILLLYGIIFLCELLSSILKKPYLKYQDKRIDNMNHVLKEYKLMKMFNWESIAFDYVNEFRRKELKYCKYRIYLNSLSNYVNAISVHCVEIVIFFVYIRSKINSNDQIDVNSIITPLFVYKSLINGVISFPTIFNNILEGPISNARINRYINHYFHDSISSKFFYSKIKNKIKNSYTSNKKDDNYMNMQGKSEIFVPPKKNTYYSSFLSMISNENYGYDDDDYGSNTTDAGLSHCLINSEKGLLNNKNGNNKITRNTDEDHINNKTVAIDILNKGNKMNEINEHIKSKNIADEKYGIDKKIIIKFENCNYKPINFEKNNDQLKNIKLKNIKLKNINFTLKNNTIAIIVGDVGSGKSLFFNSILGKFKLINGNYYIKNFIYDMPVLYAPQINWLSDGTIRSMVTFESKFDPYIYYLAISQSELINDIYSFKNLDMRCINDEHSLSKGQKSRISLARSLYYHYINMKQLCDEYIEMINAEECALNSTPENNLGLSKLATNYYDKNISNMKSIKVSKSIKNFTLHNDNQYKNSTDPNIYSDGSEQVKGNNQSDDIDTNSFTDDGKFSYSDLQYMMNNNYLKDCLEKNDMSYLYLLDDIFTSIDPFISRNIFYNLFCDKETLKNIKNHCGIVITINENALNSFIMKDIIDNLQYNVDVYKLENGTLDFQGNINEYINKKKIQIKTSEMLVRNETENDKREKMLSFFKKTGITMNNFKMNDQLFYMSMSLELCHQDTPQTEVEIRNNDSIEHPSNVTVLYKKDNPYIDKNNIIYNKIILLKELKLLHHLKSEDTNEACSINKKFTILMNNHFNKIVTESIPKDQIHNISPEEMKTIKKDRIREYIGNFIIDTKGNNETKCLKNKKTHIDEFEEMNIMLKKNLKEHYTYYNNYIRDNANESNTDVARKGNIKFETFRWYFRNIGNTIIIIIIIFVIISIFLDEVKNMLLFLVSALLKTKDKSYDEAIQKKLVYLKYFVLLPSLSLVTTLISYMIIAHGIMISAKKMHTEIFKNMLYAPIHAFYSHNIGNIINRFIIDIHTLDNGIIKRCYKSFYTIFKFISTVILLVFMFKNTYIMLPFIILIVYYGIFKKYSVACKEAQRGFLCSHSPICAIFNNTIHGKDIINLYKKNDSVLKRFENSVYALRNFTLFKWGITVWASLYIQLVGLCLTSFYILYPHFFSFLKNTHEGVDIDVDNYIRYSEVIGYCITFSCSLGYTIKSFLYDYTHVEKEMCSIQRLEELSKIKDMNGDTRLTSVENYEHDKQDIPIAPSQISESKYGLEFKNIYVSYKKKIYIDKLKNTYYYANEKSCLRNINFYALKNQNIGIIGKSGAGKSTIIMTILGLISTTKGEIKIEGRDIRSIPLEERKKIIGILPQSSFVFSHWNIRTYIDPYQTFSDNEIIDAFKIIGINLTCADLYKYISKSKNKKNNEYDRSRHTEVQNNENYILMSDDSIRYLSLVRIYLNRNNYKLLLIDEIPVINFNKNNEFNNFFTKDLKPFSYIIDNYFKNITTLIISHDTRTLSSCDFIYVVSKGEIVYKCNYSDIETQTQLANIIQDQAN